MLRPRLQQLDEENGELRSCTPCLKANIERLEEVSCQPERGAGRARRGTVWASRSAGPEVSFPAPFAPATCWEPGWAGTGSLKRGSQPMAAMQAGELLLPRAGW